MLEEEKNKSFLHLHGFFFDERRDAYLCKNTGFVISGKLVEMAKHCEFANEVSLKLKELAFGHNH